MAKLNDKKSSRRQVPRPPRVPVRTLRLCRLDRDQPLTQEALAEGAGMTKTRYWQIEHGEGAPVRDTERAAIARMLGVPSAAISWPTKTPTPMQLARALAQDRRRQQQMLMAAESA